MRFRLLTLPVLATLLAQHVSAGESSNWWNKEWTQRQPVAVSAKDAGDAGAATVLVRLHDGNFQFPTAKEDGSDLRFIGDDGKELPYQIEKYDGLMNEAFVWVKVPAVKGGEAKFTLYYGNPKAAAPAAAPAYDADTVLVYHFAERGAAPVDSSPAKNNGDKPGAASEGAVVGGGLRLAGGEPVGIPNTATLEWTANQALTWSAWVKPAALRPNAILFSRDTLRVVLDQGVLIVENNGVRSSSGAPLAAGAWSHVAFVAEGAAIKTYVNGVAAGSLAAGLPASTAPLLLGGTAAPVANSERFNGELDELEISRVARPEGWLKLAALTQGTSEAATKAVAVGEVEGGEGGAKHSAALEHIMLFGDIAKNMMFDGWMAIGVCVLMILVGWSVAVKKFFYLNSIQKGGKVFLDQWKKLSGDLTALDHGDKANVSSFGGLADARTQALVKQSPLYHLYHIGSEEIRHRLERDKTRTKGLSGRSIEAIRASLDAGLVHENHHLNKGLVFLTMSIAGGPYVGLLGTVVGVMITFAIIAKSGEVDVNSIAPGIASALLATVAGLIVAIPALFIYSYLSSKIKESMGTMQVFIDEFIAKMAEFYPPAGESTPHVNATQAHANAHPVPKTLEPV
ncbi:DUF2341 domain-containing protein [Luteolibacter ambystomatis]|uniref:DUF2341 domain-containing protein n=1 Tax=Luteolibacter ambystomatis TaxID=2824561 RepID=A0A975PFE6_9BACT|nr:DUF2341 domain-containing protein [Luteolibacter ambystomatis]QUE51566.1 DUF2341 domain-containing protein [Luteolibacter ambystomatis]